MKILRKKKIAVPVCGYILLIVANGDASKLSSIISLSPLALYPGADPPIMWWGAVVYTGGKSVLIYADTGRENRSIQDSISRVLFMAGTQEGRRPPGLWGRW